MFFIWFCFISFSLVSTRFHSRSHHLSINENEISPRHLLSFNLINSIRSYQIVSTNSPVEKFFSIVNQTDLYAVESLDREYFCSEQMCSCSSICSIQLKILSQPQQQIIFVNLTINDLNDNQHYFRSNEIRLKIPENTNIFHRQCYRIPPVEDKDLPETNQIVYQLIGDGNEQFELDQNFGNDLCLRIRNRSLDREEKDHYEHLWIVATDQQYHQAKIKVFIQVLDVNDNSPKFKTNLTKIRLNETFIGELICVEAFDPDEGNNGRVIYSFDNLDEKLFEYLSLNNQTGCLTINHPLSLTSNDLIPILQFNNHLLLTLRAQDSGSKMSSTLPVYHPIELIIEDINDHRPTIQVRQIISSIDFIRNNSQIYLMENTIGLVAMVTVDDRDHGIFGQIHLTLIVQSNVEQHQQAFQLKSTSTKHFKIELISPLDREMEKSMILYLDAVDGGGEHTRFLIEVFIDDQNDLEPRFEHDNYHFITNVQSTTNSFDSTIVGQVHAIDPDSSTNSLIYSLNSNYFRIDSETGQIHLISPLTNDLTDKTIDLNVSVTDGQHRSFTLVTISIEGLNHRPQFVEEHFQFEIDENLPVRTIIGQIKANDEDSPTTRRGELTYSLHSLTPHSEFFFHTSHNGEILIARTPDAEKCQIHLFNVTVRDHGTPPLTNEAKLTIKVKDLNEFCPKLVNFTSEPFLFVSREKFLKKNFDEKLSFRLNAFDDDRSDQSNIRFDLISSSIYSKYFHLSSNGILTIVELPEKIPSTIEIEIRLRDQFVENPCEKREKLLLLFGQTSNDRQILLNQYEKDLQMSRHDFIQKKFSSMNNSSFESFYLVLPFSLAVLVIFLGISCLLYLICCRKTKRQESIRTKSSSLIDESKQQSPHSFITDVNGKSSLLKSLR